MSADIAQLMRAGEPGADRAGGAVLVRRRSSAGPGAISSCGAWAWTCRSRWASAWRSPPALYATLTGGGEVYFDSITMFVFFLLCGRYLEMRARQKAAASLEYLDRAMPLAAHRLVSYPASRDTEEVAGGVACSRATSCW